MAEGVEAKRFVLDEWVSETSGPIDLNNVQAYIWLASDGKTYTIDPKEVIIILKERPKKSD